MSVDSCILIHQLQSELADIRQALLSASGVLRESTDPKAKQAAAILFKGVRKVVK